ncbi:hypothetical protein PU345_002108 [Enterobacter kobei]|nr:hypothetical protein [Enterobacter kobei]
MSVELKEFNGACLIKDKASTEGLTLKSLAIMVHAANKTAAERIIEGKLLEYAPAHAGYYFKAKIWEHREGLPRITASPGVFCTDFFHTQAVWNRDTGEPAAAQPETASTDSSEDFRQEATSTAERVTPVKDLDLTYRAYCLVMFGPVEQVTEFQRGQMVDIYNDDYDVLNPLREQAEGIAKEPRVLSLPPEMQAECLVWVRRNAREDAKWPEYKNLYTRWLDTVLATHTATEAEFDETKPAVSGVADLPAVCPGRTAQLNQELDAAFSNGDGQQLHDQQPEMPPAPGERDTVIAHALNDLFSGRTRLMSEMDVVDVLETIGHDTAHTIPLLMGDIATTESTLSPEFSDDEIHDVAMTVFCSWSDNIHIRRQTALDAIVEYRRPVPQKQAHAVIADETMPEAHSDGIVSPAPLTYQQHLTIAALQGLCANPAYCHARHDLPLMAIDMASDVINQQGGPF